MPRPAIWKCLSALTAIVFAANDGAAQQPAPPPGCDRAEYRQFDMWLGDWVVLNPAGDTIGTNRIERISDGCALLEQWRDAGGGTGTSINFFEPETGRWNQLWVGGRGMVLRLEGGLSNGAMELAGTSPRTTPRGPVLDRIRWTALEDGSVEQLWLISADDGGTWQESFRGIYRRAAPAN